MSEPDPATERRRAQDAIFTDINAVLASTSKWLVAALGAIGAILVAGSQLSSLGSLPLGARFVTAVIGATIALVCVLVSIWLVMGLLAPERYYMSDLAKEWEEYEELKKKSSRRAARRFPVSAWFEDHTDYLGGQATPAKVHDSWRSKEAELEKATSTRERERLEAESALHLASVDGVVAMANYQRNRVTFKRMRIPLGFLMSLAAIGIGIFAWAANPAEKGPPSLRNGDLQGADLSGAFLGYADLTGADLTDANLQGANLTGAKVSDVIWANTICPDGTNSDDVARADGTKGTCEGHLDLSS